MENPEEGIKEMWGRVTRLNSPVPGVLGEKETDSRAEILFKRIPTTFPKSLKGIQ